MVQSINHLLSNDGVGLAEVAAALAVADDDPREADVLKHVACDLQQRREHFNIDSEASSVNICQENE